MVGIFGRLFGSRSKAGSTASSETAAKPAQKKDNTFFLDPDEAKTLGNIEYMRTPRIVKHTFQDFGSTEKVEVVEQVSSLGRVKLAMEQAKTEAPSEQGSSFSSSGGASPRRQGGSDMDTFRNMARSLKRK